MEIKYLYSLSSREMPAQVAWKNLMRLLGIPGCIASGRGGMLISHVEEIAALSAKSRYQNSFSIFIKVKRITESFFSRYNGENLQELNFPLMNF